MLAFSTAVDNHCRGPPRGDSDDDDDDSLFCDSDDDDAPAPPGHGANAAVASAVGDETTGPVGEYEGGALEQGEFVPGG